MYCQMRIDSPNDAPSDMRTVPTMTTAATRLSGHHHHDHEDQAQCRDASEDEIVFRAVGHILEGGCRAGQGNLGVFQRGGLDRLDCRDLDRLDV